MNSLRFDSEIVGQPQARLVSHRGLQHRGEVIVADTPDPEYGRPLDLYLSFRIVFFTVPRRIPVGQIRDPRVAMAVPRRVPDPTRQTLNREISAIREAKERYITAADPDAHALRASIEEREVSLRGELARRDALSYSQGRIYTRPGITIHPGEIFVEENADYWASRLADKVLLAVFPRLPFDHAALQFTLTAGHLASLYRGAFCRDPRAAEMVRGLGPVLGLTRREAPTTFDAGDCPVVDIIRSAMESHGGQMRAEELLRLLVERHGLNYALSTLYVLAFVRQARAEVGLRPGHSVRSLRGRLFLSDRIAWDTVQEVSFSEELADSLTQVRLRPSQTWNAALPYAALLVQGLQMGDEVDVPPQERRLLEALAGLARRLEASRKGISALASRLDESADRALATMDRLQALCVSRDYRTFHSNARSGFEGPSGLRRALDVYARLEQLSDLAPAITRARDYLDEMTFGREHRDLQLQREALVGRIALDSLTVNPALWSSIREGYQALRRRYTAAYVSHHHRYRQEAIELGHRLERWRPQVEALARFNEVPELGGPFETDVPRRFVDLADSTKTCPVGDADLSLEEAPHCRACMVRLSDEVPKGEAELLCRAAKRAMQEYNRRLSSRGVREILAHPAREPLDKFINLVQVSDLSALANVLDDDVVEFLRRFAKPG